MTLGIERGEAEQTSQARSVFPTMCALAVCMVVAACAGRDDVATAETAEARAPTRAGGALRGTVRLSGTMVPDRSLIENSTDPEVCGATQRADDLLVDTETRGIANVIVSVRDVPAVEGSRAEPYRLVLDNRDCQFVPRVAVLTVGDTIEAVSHDHTLHTVHLYGAIERNIALPDPSASMVVTVERPGMIAVLCDVHGWMKAYLRVDDHPLHAVSDGRGRFVIDSVPAGSWELDVWHERLGSQTLSVSVAPGGGDEIEISFPFDGVGASIASDTAPAESNGHRHDDP